VDSHVAFFTRQARHSLFPCTARHWQEERLAGPRREVSSNEHNTESSYVQGGFIVCAMHSGCAINSPQPAGMHDGRPWHHLTCQ
jgi:hypothetical protein